MADRATELLKEILQRKNVPISEICRKTGLKYELIRRSLNEGRSLKVDEFISICKTLGLDMQEFIK